MEIVRRQNGRFKWLQSEKRDLRSERASDADQNHESQARAATGTAGRSRLNCHSASSGNADRHSPPGKGGAAMAYPARVRLPALLAAAQRALAAAAMRARPAALIFRLPRFILVGVFPLAFAQRARWAAAIRARVAADRVPPRRPGEPPSTPLSSSANCSICSFRATARRSC
jgi:hypothetical protein